MFLNRLNGWERTSLAIATESPGIFICPCEFSISDSSFLGMDSYREILEESSRRFGKLAAKPQKFLQSGDELFGEFKLLAKVIYDLGKLAEKETDAKECGNY
jgi:hypothetical protein